jgi:hypothetical protein
METVACFDRLKDARDWGADRRKDDKLRSVVR